MVIDLFEHNRTACNNAMEFLRTKKKAAVIHPTGTGKSFIGFQLCAEHPDSVVCWLSPSKYIFQTQLENLKSATGGELPQNIRFYTYTKLVLMDVSDMKRIEPDYIILDEFHRCGADIWGSSVQVLLSLYPDTPILGLSATNIRYLDNRRDMANELFDGNIASEMTLGEAIVRGILNAPKYIISLYSYQQEFERYKSKAAKARSKAVRDAAEEQLQALRRAIENADGLDIIFQKHMTDVQGKYIVFCVNKEHMDEMVIHVPEWFGKIDPSCHIYRAYAEDPTTAKEFSDFKSDNSEHLKLLFCIDMLNEGIHVEDVSGVILFRPTISPIIYKQQIGRALSASKSKAPVIIDVVKNFSNLYSISSVQEEMQESVIFFRDLGDDGSVVTERFTIIDEARNCLQLFNQLEETLTASWALMYAHAKVFFKEHGHLNVPKKYTTPEGFSLGSWLQTQRRVYNGSVSGILTQEQIGQLNEIGMRWENYYDYFWEQGFAEAAAYHQAFGNLEVPSRYISPSGFRLGCWLNNIRRQYKFNSDKISPARVAALNQLGMLWDVRAYTWDKNIIKASQYFERYGNLDIPANYFIDGFNIGTWIRSLRRLYRSGSLTQDKIDRLNKIGMLWNDSPERKWELLYEQAKKFFSEHGGLDVPSTYVTADGFPLGKWLNERANNYDGLIRTNGVLTPERLQMLYDLGFKPKTKDDPWEIRFNLAKEYYVQHGNLVVSSDYSVNGLALGKWLNEQKQIFRGNRREKSLTPVQISRLESIGMVWDGIPEITWKNHFLFLKDHLRTTGSLNFPKDAVFPDSANITRWLQRQRKNLKDGKLEDWQIQMLAEIGIE